ncbi:hypothetical protein M5K25_026476 [Dendrobium thyrsiflorum]|uniref:Uncharacterized protein n=1 Tax=Dendrobium thyrsiflorum TaxID=117978 RepID=A0ABD0TXJ9_DENTH
MIRNVYFVRDTTEAGPHRPPATILSRASVSPSSPQVKRNTASETKHRSASPREKCLPIAPGTHANHHAVPQQRHEGLA